MRFRSKIFLSVFLPSVVLVAAGAAIAIRSARETVYRHATENLETARVYFDGQLAQQFALLSNLARKFQQPRTEEEILLILEKKETDTLKDWMEVEFGEFDRSPALWEARTREGKLLARVPDGGGLPQPWEAKSTQALTAIDGVLYAAFLVRFDISKHTLLFAEPFRSNLEAMKGGLKNVDIVLEQGGRAVHSSFPGGTPAPPGEGEVAVNGVPHLAVVTRPAVSTLDRIVLLSSLQGVQDARKAALTGGAVVVGLAGLVAGLVSSLLSRGVSRPVEALVVATKRVGEGDYTAKVEVPGRDELARLGSAFNDMTEGLRKRRDIMEKTLTRDVAEELMKGVELGGERREVTVMFMDVRGFTRATEGVDPAEVVAMLNDMMGELAASIARHGGNVNKFLGDGLLAMFGAPKDLPDHALKAARAALEMQSAMTAWGERRKGRGLPPLHIGIGLNTGVVLGGKVGSKERLEYTLIGEEVNLASRVCGKAAPGQVLATKTTADRLAGRLGLTELEPVQVKGLSYPVQIYEVKA